MIDYQVNGLDPAEFAAFFARNDDELRAHGAVRVFAEDDGYPCRTMLKHATIGDELLLINYTHQPNKTPYFSSGPIYVCRKALAPVRLTNAIPDMLHVRPLSIRGYGHDHMIVDADVCDGADAEVLIQRLLANSQISYLHVHLARRGCYACHVARIEA
jgi:Protein of unknown function (DUF1203)